MTVVFRFCSECSDERLFEQPPCIDGHGVDCPELACVDCGTAVVVGFDVEAVLLTSSVASSRVSAAA